MVLWLALSVSPCIHVSLWRLWVCGDVVPLGLCELVLPCLCVFLGLYVSVALSLATSNPFLSMSQSQTIL